ncbi:helix-turn-helix transcriptional regulator [Nocardioides gansuensis]|uniref:helix-turn-helix transcriptional regulator n=1 Tax=Nocardioides gansuensis TaxID=2138300 RepID=UPI001403CB96|nr:helix-turn-helix transcriptional regulator [Nocardioides gansuensis]
MPAPRSPDLVGRDAELQELSSWLGIRVPAQLRAASGDATRAVLLGGDAGVGKTRLLTELRDVATADGWLVVAGHCLDLAESSLPYLPFSEILGRLMTDLPDVVAEVTERHPTLVRLQPGRRIRGTDDRDDDLSLDRGNIFAAVHDLLETAAASASVLVVVEDAHWADQATRDMLSFLFSRPFAGPVSLVVSFRSDDLHRRHPLRPQVAEWTRVRGVERMQLEPLTPIAVRHLVKALRPGTISEAELAAIVDRSEGNPFFVEELVGAAWDGQIPVELADVLLVRLDRLDDTTREVVRLASVAGRQVSHDLLAAVSGLDASTLERAVRAAVESHVLVAGRHAAYSFRHALLGEAVYDDLLPGERTRLHADFAAAMKSGSAVGTAAELAQHARRAGDLPTALRAEIEAGNEAMAVGGPHEAATHFLDALEIVGNLRPAPEDIDQAGLVRRCAEAFIASGRVSKAVKVLRAHLEALPADAPDLERGQLLTEIAAALMLTDSTESPEKVAAEAVSLLQDAPPKHLARALAVQAQCLGRWNADEARVVAMEAMALAERHNLTGLVVDLTTTLASLDTVEESDQLEAAWGAAVARAREAGLIEPELRARYFLARLRHDRGERAEAIEGYRQVVARAEETGMPWAPYPAEARAMLGLVLVDQGRLDEAFDLLDVSDQQPPMVFEWLYFAIQMRVCTLHGRQHGDSLERLRHYWSVDGLIAIIAGTAELDRADHDGDPHRAMEVYERIVDTLRPLWHEWFQARLRLAATVIGVHASAAARQSAEERLAAAPVVAQLFADGERVIERYADYEIAQGPEARAWMLARTAEHLRWRWLSQLDPPAADDLLAAWRETEAAFATYGSVPELARVRARYAAVLRATGDAAAARQMADLARQTAHALDLRPLLDELTALGSSAAPRSEAVADALTPRESEILALVAEGRTNGEIGKQLFISTKTVSVHVSNILGKLGAASRTEAAAIARRRGLL